MYRFEPSRITREILLNTHSEEEYFSFYGIPPKKGLFCSPMRADRNPTCSFYRNKHGVLKFKDFGTGDNFDFIQLVMSKFNVTYSKALKIIANDFNLITREHYTKNTSINVYDNIKIDDQGVTAIQCEIREFSNEDLAWWNKFGITEKTLKKFKVYAVKHVFLNGVLSYSESKSNPIYGYYFGKKDGIEMWKIYFPLRKKYRFLLNCSEIQGLSKLPSNGEIVVVTKSYKDVMTLYELGIPAIAPQCESIIINEDVYKKLSSRFNTVIFNGDWDKAGKLFMIKSTLRYKSLAMSFIDKQKFGKDISDFVSIHGMDKARELFNSINLDNFQHQLTRCQRIKQKEK